MTYSHRGHLEDSAIEIHFGPYRLLPRRHLLLKNGEPVSLGSRALTLLIALASRPGELLEKTQLLDIAWPRLVVEECNLRAQIKAIRRALGDDDSVYIATATGQGYRFVAPTWVERGEQKKPVVLGVYSCRRCLGDEVRPMHGVRQERLNS
ncbi:winged helix-turn-helix domain-containing protein [Pseudomonas sp. D8002]|uniref:winged helix-turn-helix domain-containing protein n=1 Tax=Pseudomonas sp. D8002 TaxID=2738816 RepID=UPI0015A167B9|nr:winged helix-turn-helix domain-containing protein [Pseudomonas sp. D8002]NWA88883.1 winged helix-turn-helix domain-containing protein [Pseudomonas sp. D8002]